MPTIGFHAQHEQAHPRDLRDSAVHAEQAGFDAVMCSDHLAPWSRRQGHSGLTFAWLGAALQATERVPMGCFHAPGQRYHPVISAQAFATLAAMFPGRFPWVALGSGEALNEHVTGDPWPTKDVRMARLRECVDVMRALWRCEEVSHRGLVTVDRARVWSLPDGAEVKTLPAEWGAERLAVTFDRLLVGCRDGTVRVIDARTWAEVLQFTGHKPDARPEGRRDRPRRRGRADRDT